MADKTSTAVSLRADQSYVKSLRALAQERKMTVADLVRGALDAQLGPELEPLVIFFANRGNKDSRSAMIESESA